MQCRVSRLRLQAHSPPKPGDGFGFFFCGWAEAEKERLAAAVLDMEGLYCASVWDTTVPYEPASAIFRWQSEL